VNGLRRSWLFVAGADERAHAAAARSGADVLVQELEDFTPPELRPRARVLAASLYERWRATGALVAVRVNPLETCGREDLAAVLAGRPDVVMMSKVATPEQVRALHDATAGRVELVPNVETAAGLMRTFDIVRASPRVTAALVASEDMVADLGTARSRGGEELAYVRARFLAECRAAGVEAIDCPYTFSDTRGAAADARRAKRLGYRAKSLVAPAHAAAINRVFTPRPAEIARARRIVAAFEKARAAGRERATVDGALIEVPIYAAARRLLDGLRKATG
jgi:citrate lyase subunit beta/citryl-CoA lyase